MNAVTRTLTNRTFLGRSFSINLPVPKLHVFVLLLVVLVTAISVVYVKDLNRRLYNSYQNLGQTNMTLVVNHSKLLIEESALSAQARVQRLAAQKLNMMVPTRANIDIVKL